MQKAVLVIDRDNAVISELKETIQRLGYVAASVTNGADALTFIENIGISTVVLIEASSVSDDDVRQKLLAKFQCNDISLVQILKPGDSKIPGVSLYLSMPICLKALSEVIGKC